VKRLPIAPRPFTEEVLSSWMTRTSAVNGLSVPELVEHAIGKSTGVQTLQVDRGTPRALIEGLAQVCAISPNRLARLDLCAQFPHAPAPWFLPLVHHLPNRYRHFVVSIPSCHMCFMDHERMGTSPYWKADWALALVTLCPQHVDDLAQYCRHCFIGLLSLVADSRHGGLVVRCTSCFQAAAFYPISPARVGYPRQFLVASLSLSLVRACRGIEPDPMWLGPIDPAMFISVVDDLIWFLMDGNLDGGYPLISRSAPAPIFEMSAIRRCLWQRPLNRLSVPQREIIAAAVAVALLGNRIYEHSDCCSFLPSGGTEAEAYPFSSVTLFPVDLKTRAEIAKRVENWPGPLKQRALRHLPFRISAAH
jgi:TniQ